MPSSPNSRSRIAERVAELSNTFAWYFTHFEVSRTFGGPSIYFHEKAVVAGHRHLTVRSLLADPEFFDSLYATLTAWGMHRMGPGNTKLLPIDQLKAGFVAVQHDLSEIENLNITDLTEEQLPAIIKSLWSIISRLTVSEAAAKIVANSKALHHVIPKLLPPIDRSYTFMFFYNKKNLSISEEEAFTEMYTEFHRLAVQHRTEIEAAIGSPWNSSETKVLDNAIIGYVLSEL